MTETNPQVASQADRATNDTITPTQVQFHGDAKEYFSIWIVNILLTIVTLGIYSAWATVRNNRYFYSNTDIGGHRLSYLAQPLQILKGRIIAVLLFLAYMAINTLSPIFGGFALIALMICSPFLIVLSLRFKMRMTAYRNVSFEFTGSYSRALLYFIVLPFASIFTLYLLMPYALKKIDQYIYNNIKFGDRACEANLSSGTYYGAVFGAALVTMLAILVLVVTIGGTATLAALSPMEHPELLFGINSVFFVLGYVFVFVIASSIYAALIRNHIYNNSEFENVARFESDLSIASLTMLRVTNFFAIVLSLGVLIPWAKIRLARLYADSTKVAVLPDIDKVIGQSHQQQNALADEAASIFDVDVGFG